MGEHSTLGRHAVNALARHRNCLHAGDPHNPAQFIKAPVDSIDEVIRLARIGLEAERRRTPGAAHLDARDLSALRRALDWLARDEAGRTMTVDYHEGEVRLFLEQRRKRGETEDGAWNGQSSDFAGALDDCETDGWRDGL
jgi:hypothetical protein